MNKSLLLKWLWHFGIEENGLWRKVIALKYGAINKWDPGCVIGPHGANLWKGIMSLVKRFKEAIHIEVKNSQNTIF